MEFLHCSRERRFASSSMFFRDGEELAKVLTRSKMHILKYSKFIPLRWSGRRKGGLSGLETSNIACRSLGTMVISSVLGSWTDSDGLCSLSTGPSDALGSLDTKPGSSFTCGFIKLVVFGSLVSALLAEKKDFINWSIVGASLHATLGWMNAETSLQLTVEVFPKLDSNGGASNRDPPLGERQTNSSVGAIVGLWVGVVGAKQGKPAVEERKNKNQTALITVVCLGGCTSSKAPRVVRCQLSKSSLPVGRPRAPGEFCLERYQLASRPSQIIRIFRLSAHCFSHFSDDIKKKKSRRKKGRRKKGEVNIQVRLSRWINKYTTKKIFMTKYVCVFQAEKGGLFP
ncbi:hypothetical protein VP01_2685g1 [Puccinia sorghi]|uniref:Uncharacterized protein n=1 Tax=Puccinia sorghi TaxID=27349 RepID=A0A0L6V5M3_9BASI|nr:hypothetical protein VP01_2685g1 [Puccinia sorghi]